MTYHVQWSQIEAECDGYREGFVKIYRKYEGMPTDEKDAQGRTVKVTQRSFAEHAGIPERTFRRWVSKSAAAADQLIEPPRDRAREEINRQPPSKTVDDIMSLPDDKQDEVYHEHSIAVAEDLGITRTEASDLIQAYLAAQTSRKLNTLFVLSREGRTKRAVWHVGARSADVRGLGAQTADDFKRRIDRFVAPTLVHISERNPRALPAAKAVAKGIEAGVELMVSMLGGEAA